MRIQPLTFTTLVWLCACAPPPPAAPPPPPAAPVFEFPYAQVWTAHERVAIRGDTTVVVPRPLTRLTVLSADSSGIEVRCDLCRPPLAGRVGHREVLTEASAPAEAARGTLAEFALAVRDAADRGDLSAVAPVMNADFFASYLGPQSAARALAAWSREGLRTLRRVPDLLDRGLATRDSLLWVAPPEHVETHAYRGLRLGFKRGPHGRWEWLFLLEGERP